MRKEGDKVTNWQDVLNDNPIPWLLEPDNPPVRYLWTVLEYPYFGGMAAEPAMAQRHLAS
jgi:hypothetical protein